MNDFKRRSRRQERAIFIESVIMGVLLFALMAAAAISGVKF